MKYVIRSVLVGAVGFFIFTRVLPAASAPKVEGGKKVTLYYQLFVNGTLVEKADAKEPFTYTHGKEQIVPGLEKGLSGLRVGDKKTIHVKPDEAYGAIDSKAFQEVETDKLPPDVPQKVGTLLEARSARGEMRLVKITEVKEKSVIIDFNHPLAGKELVFQVEVAQVS